MASDVIPNLNRRIVFFDGECVFCNRTVGVLIWLDRRHRLAFAPLQGVTARALMFDFPQGEAATLVYWERGERYFRSEAVVRLLRACGGMPAGLGWVLGGIPRGWADTLYNWIARHRWAVFGRQQCFMASGADERFLP